MSDQKTTNIILRAIKDQEIEAMVFTTSVYSKRDKDQKQQKEFQNAIHIFLSDFNLMIDAHMHIQSLNITPMPLQWATTFLRTEGPVSQKRKGRTRRQMNDEAAGFPADIFVHDFGRIGRLPTDLVGKVFMCNAKNNDFRRDLYWIIGADEETEREEAGETAHLEDLSSERETHYSNHFYKNTAYYFKNNKVISQFIVLMMDLSYAHYWGKWYLPINLPMPFDADRGFYYINDFIEIKTEKAWFSNDMNLSVNTRDYVPDEREGKKLHLYYNVDLKEQYERFLLYVKSYCGLSKEKPKPFYIYFEDDTHIAASLLSMKINSAKDQEHAEALIQSLEDIYTPLVRQRYKHFLEPIPGDNAEIFEDFWKQCDHTTACALRYPLQFFTFYHYDPRRHYQEEKNYQTGTDNYRPIRKFDDLNDSHAFFTYRVAQHEFTFFTEDSKEVKYKGDFLQINPLRLDEISYTDPDETYFDRLIKDHIQENAGKSCGYLKSNTDMFKMINSKNTRGFYWGIKMYPALGYNPDDFTYFPHLHDFYETCIKEEIPIMIHSSPLGMTIADPHNYILYDRDFTQGRLNTFKRQMLRAEEIYNHPRNWRNVLTHANGKYKDLKICLAHFGGESFWRNPPDQVREINEIPDTRGEILEMIEEFPNVYTDMACWTSRDRAQLARNIAVALNNSDRLRKRLMMGSDWYMMETSIEGVPNYYNRMFTILREVSKEVDYDAWYEFSVVNPLRYLGLIDSEADMDDTKIIMDKVFGFREVAREKVKDTNVLEYYDFEEEDLDRVNISMKEESELDEEDKIANSLLIQLQKIKIKKSEEIVNEKGNLLILK